MSETGSKFGMLRNLQQAVTEEETAPEPVKRPQVAKQKSAKTLKQQSTVRVQEELSESAELKHYSSYMPLPLFAQLQIHVAKQKAVRGNSGGKVSIQSVIAQAVQQYLETHDK